MLIWVREVLESIPAATGALRAIQSPTQANVSMLTRQHANRAAMKDKAQKILAHTEKQENILNLHQQKCAGLQDPSVSGKQGLEILKRGALLIPPPAAAVKRQHLRRGWGCCWKCETGNQVSARTSRSLAGGAALLIRLGLGSPIQQGRDKLGS